MSGPVGAATGLLPTAAAAVAPMPLTEQLMYATVRLENQSQGVIHWGTGHLFALFKTNTSSLPVIVTNHHVVDGWDSCTFNFTGARPDGSPDLQTHIPVTLTNFQNSWIRHPSVDLVIIPIGGVLTQLANNGQSIFIRELEPSLIPTDQELSQLLPVEQVLTVGYPGQLWDNVNNLPLFHRGYTSTAPYLDFQGRQEFLIDIATWPGSSGSPVMLFNDNGYIDRRGNTMLGGVRIKLLGVVYGVGVADVTGNVAIQLAPTQLLASSSMVVPTNLGACLRSSRILEFEPILVKQGFLLPAGYNMRFP